MLFLVNSSGVPSVAKFVKLSSSGGNPAPTVTSISPTSGTARWDGGEHHRHRIPGGSDGQFGRDRGDRRDRSQQHDDHGDHCGPRAGAVNVVVTNTDRQSGALANGYTYTSSLGLKGAPGRSKFGNRNCRTSCVIYTLSEGQERVGRQL